MKEVEVGVYHHNCWGSESAERFPETFAKVKGPINVFKNDLKTRCETVFRVDAPDRKELDSYLDFVKNHASTKKMDVFSKNRNSALYSIIFQSNGSSYDAVFDSRSLYTDAVVQENGYEKHKVIARNPNSLKKLLSELNILGEVKVLKIAAPSVDDNPYNLTDKQLLCLRVARENNYYSWPRKVTLEELASGSGFTRRAFQENLRKAEAKVLPEMLKAQAL